jgi:endonuclease/exonuclease/phosphatase (EEP) superfamily protein YafD
MKRPIIKQYFIFCLLCIGLTACVSSTPYEISSHHPDHSITPAEQSCNNTNIFKSENHKLTQYEHLDPNKISILNWNVYKGSGDSWGADFKLLSQDRDILIMQEARLDETLHQMLDTQGFHWDLTSAFRYHNSQVGVMTASKVRPIDLCSIHSKEPYIRLPKTLLVSLYQLADSTEVLLVANIHSINFTFGTEAYAEQLQTLQNILQQHTGPMIVAGDFNSWSDGRMHFIEQLEQNLDLNSLQYKSHNRTEIFGKAIDHIFYRDLTPYGLTTPQVTSSDHNPILVSFSVNKQP